MLSKEQFHKILTTYSYSHDQNCEHYPPQMTNKTHSILEADPPSETLLGLQPDTTDNV
jgi:hypothetical protein